MNPRRENGSFAPGPPRAGSELCPRCRRRMPALAEMHSRGLKLGFLPTVRDDASWEELRADHEDGCLWHETRGYRMFKPGKLAVSPAEFNAITVAQIEKEKGT